MQTVASTLCTNDGKHCNNFSKNGNSLLISPVALGKKSGENGHRREE